MARQAASRKGGKSAGAPTPAASVARPSPWVDTRIIYCGDCLDQLCKLPDACVDLIYIDPPFNSNRNYEVFWGETKEKRAFEDRHASTQPYIDYMRPRRSGWPTPPRRTRIRAVAVQRTRIAARPAIE